MTNAGLPVPPGFTIQTEACREFIRRNALSKEVDRQMEDALKRLERLQGQELGKGANPLLVSVRSGAKFSMPGMMDTILNLGLNDRSVEALAKRADARFAYDSYRRLIQMFGNVVLEIEKSAFEEVFDAKRNRKKRSSIPILILFALPRVDSAIGGSAGGRCRSTEDRSWTDKVVGFCGGRRFLPQTSAARAIRQYCYCTFCKRAISFWARLSSESDHKRRPLAWAFFSTLFVKFTSL
jgi:phosphoenolpyruvate synthase/pyruvate phosphate dikinase